jgi:hypothetical protein
LNVKWLNVQRQKQGAGREFEIGDLRFERKAELSPFVLHGGQGVGHP